VVTVDGRDAERHDLAAHPGEAWVGVPLGPAGRAATRRVALRIIAVRPDPGLGVGREYVLPARGALSA
jgi:hypothetical protein